MNYLNAYNIVVMFPYPSNDTLHLGHYYNYAIMDSYCRLKRYQGYTVHQPFGYDAFGLPAENYAKKVGGDPREITYQNIEKFRVQMDKMNTQYEEKLVTCDPEYYKWTQWLFTKLHEAGLAYKEKGEVNYCPSCETVVATAEIKGYSHKGDSTTNNHRHERCDTVVVKKEMEQWYFKTTAYKDRLLANLDKLDYPKSTITQQRQWIENLKDWCVSRQRSWGTPIPIEGEIDTLDTFVDSSFYYLRYLTKSEDEFLPKSDYKPVDLYVGGSEHACLHLIYARFIHMFLYDIGVVPQEEPFNKVIHQGMITKNGAKMSKSKGNAVSPDEYDPDVIRMYLMFIGPYVDGGDWSDEKTVGIVKFISRIKQWLVDNDRPVLSEEVFYKLESQLINYSDAFKFHKVVSSLMIFYNENKSKQFSDTTKQKFIELLKCFIPGFTFN